MKTAVNLKQKQKPSLKPVAKDPPHIALGKALRKALGEQASDIQVEEYEGAGISVSVHGDAVKIDISFMSTGVTVAVMDPSLGQSFSLSFSGLCAQNPNSIAAAVIETWKQCWVQG